MTFSPSTFDATKYSLSESVYAALALDSYSRGYGAKLHEVDDPTARLTASVGQAIGVAEVLFDSRVLGEPGGVREDESIGFYAVAYKVGNEIVISYRGSDQLGLFDGWDDFGTVTNIKAGNVDDQIFSALKFFNKVEDEIAHDPTLAERSIVVVGHSLGGALAGAVASLKGSAGLLFDNTAFEDAAAEAIDRATDYHGVDYLLETLIFRGETPWTVAQASSLKTVSLQHDVAALFRGYEQATIEQTPYLVGNFPLNFIVDMPTAHVQALLAYRLLLEEKYGSDQTWGYAARQVLSPLMTDTMAMAIGIQDSEFGNDASGVLKDMISQTIIGGEYGNSAIEAMTTDMNAFGRAVDAGIIVDDEVGYFVARYAGGLAKVAAVNEWDGILSFDAVRNLLTVDLSSATWSFVDDNRNDLGVRANFGWLMDDGTLGDADLAMLAAGPGRFDSMVFSSAISNLQLPTIEPGGVTKFVGSNGTQTVFGTASSELFDLGNGDDIVHTNGGVDWIYGGLGIDTLESDLAWSEFAIRAYGNTIVLAKRDQTNGPAIFVTEGVERFILDGHEYDASSLLNSKPVDVVIESIASQAGAAKLQWGSYGAGTIMADLGAVDPNLQDRFSWEIVGGSAFYDIDANGVIRTKVTAEFDWSFWSQRARYDTYEQWQNGQHSGLLASLLGTQYGFTVKVTDAAGTSHTENFYFYLQGGDRHVTGTEVRDVIHGSASARDVIHAFGGDDEIYGLAGDDDIYGGDGNDHIVGGSGTDRIWGGNDEDYIEVGTNSSAWGEAHDDELVATGNNNVLNGGSGTDTLRALGSGNTLVGGTEADILISAAGKSNIASYKFAMDGIELLYDGINGLGVGSGGEANGDVLTGIFDIVGSSHGDTIDMILGSGMTLRTGDGKDILNVQITDYSAVYGEDGDDVITVTKNPYTNAYGTIYGGAGNDTISGHGELHGGTGADTITSAQGDHKIYLGVDSDVDTFVFSRMKGFDQVYDFTLIDRIKIGSGYKYDDFGDVMANAVQTGAHVDIWFESDTKITIMNFQKANLTADNFLFD